MKALPQIALLTFCSILFLVGCDANTNAIPGPPFAYDDFGTEPMASHIIGPKGKDTQVIARFGSTKSTPPPEGPDVRYVSVAQAMNYLRLSVRKLAKTPENVVLRKRLAVTYSRLYKQYSSKRDAFVSAPSAQLWQGWHEPGSHDAPDAADNLSEAHLTRPPLPARLHLWPRMSRGV